MLSLSPLSILPCSPLELIDAAKDAGFDAVGLRLVPVVDTDPDIMADAALRRDIDRRLAATGMLVNDVEVMRVGPNVDVNAVVPMLQYAHDVGGRSMTVTGPRLTDWKPADEPATMDALKRLCDLAGKYGIRPSLEFMASRYISTVEDAVRCIDKIGDPNLGLCVDALHLKRSGGTPRSLANVDKSRITCVHLCDAPDAPPASIADEARRDRLYPGEGALPLRELVEAVPASVPLAVEAPNLKRKDLPIADRARELARMTKDILKTVNRATR